MQQIEVISQDQWSGYAGEQYRYLHPQGGEDGCPLVFAPQGQTHRDLSPSALTFGQAGRTIRLAEESGELDVLDQQRLAVVDEEDPPAGLNNLITASLCDLGCAERNALVAG